MMQSPEAWAEPGPVKYQPSGAKGEQAKDFGLSGPVPEQFALEKCPDFAHRATLTDGKTIGVPYPNPGYNCNEVWFH